MGVEVGRCLGRGAEAQAVDKVLRNHGVDRTDVDLRRMLGVDTRLNEVFDEGLGNEEYGLETFHALELANEYIHLVFALRERLGTVFGPKFFGANAGVDIGLLVALEFEGLVGDGVEAEIAVFRDAFDLEFLQEAGEL